MTELADADADDERATPWLLLSPPNSAIFTTRSVADGTSQVVHLVLDEDSDWQALDSPPRSIGDAILVALDGPSSTARPA